MSDSILLEKHLPHHYLCGLKWWEDLIIMDKMLESVTYQDTNNSTVDSSTSNYALWYLILNYILKNPNIWGPIYLVDAIPS